MEKIEKSIRCEKSIKPRVNLDGINGNVFCVIGKVVETLNKSGLRDSADEFSEKALQADGYEDVLKLIHKYVTVVGLEEAT